MLIVKFDNVLKNGQLYALWPHYVKAIELAKQNVDKLNGDRLYGSDEIEGLSNVIQRIDYLFSKDLFQVSHAPNECPLET